ncbi:hypothetical protein HOY80DRAFT_964177 [Tuber brumale]|nr:hypothetical protein HOY80DRAFT_964177 [Tuber brumale]
MLTAVPVIEDYWPRRDRPANTTVLPGKDTTANLDTILSERHSRGFKLGRVRRWRCLIF